MTIYSLDVLLFLFGTSLLFHVQFCCFLTCIQISQETGQVVWYSHVFQNFPQLIVIHTVKGFGIANKALLCKGYIYYSSSFSEKTTYWILRKRSLKRISVYQSFIFSILFFLPPSFSYLTLSFFPPLLFPFLSSFPHSVI